MHTLESTISSPGHGFANAADDRPSRRRCWYVAALLMCSYFLAYVDRSVVNLLIEPIKADLSLSDTEISLGVGSSFAIFFAVAGIPLGRLADTASRKWVVVGSLVAWSAMTALCGFAKSFGLLFAARVGIGIGEAGLNPSAMSIISDMFPKEKRQFAITLYIVSGVLGAGFAVLIGAALLSVGEHLTEIAVVPGMRPWQWVFVLIAAPAIPLALLLIFTVKEPRRRNDDGDADDNIKVPVKEVVAYYRARWRWLLPMLLGSSAVLTVSIGFLVWGIPLVQRMHGLDAKQAALAVGIPVFFSGVLGNFVTSYFGHYLVKRGYADGMMRAMLIICWIAAIPVCIAPLFSSLTMFILLSAPFMGLMTAMSALPQITIQMIVPNRFRGQTIALFYFVINIVSYTVGPTAVALLTDEVFRSELMVGKSLAIVGAVAFPLAILLFSWALPHFRAETEAAGLGKKPA